MTQLIGETLHKRATLRDISRIAKVSVSVAGTILNGGAGSNSRASKETAARVMEIAAKLGYRPNLAARQLRGKRTHMFGLLVVSAGDPYRALLVERLDVEAIKIGCHSLIGNTVQELQGPDQFSYYIDQFTDRSVDGVICAVHRWFPGDRKALLSRHPNTVFYENPGVPGASWVAPDRVEAARMSVRHLFQRGRRKIGLAMLDLPWEYYQERIDGHFAELAECGLEPNRNLLHLGDWRTVAPELITGVVTNVDYLKVLSDRAVDDLVCGQGADAIVAHDDYWAAVLVKRLLRRGIDVPSQVAVVGFSNHYMAPWVDRPLTTVDLCYRASAHYLVEMLERMVTEGPLPEEERVTLVKPQLTIRESG